MSIAEPKTLSAIPLPTDWEGEQFVLLILGGMPPMEALSNLVADLSTWTLQASAELLTRWQSSPAVKKAMAAQMSVPWHKMSLEDRMSFAINKHYNEMAYYLFANNYAQLEGTAKLKADTCRIAIEARQAGNSGKIGPMEEFVRELNKVKGVAAPKATFPKAPPLPLAEKVDS